jgi:hypothetical protein
MYVFLYTLVNVYTFWPIYLPQVGHQISNFIFKPGPFYLPHILSITEAISFAKEKEFISRQSIKEERTKSQTYFPKDRVWGYLWDKDAE